MLKSRARITVLDRQLQSRFGAGCSPAPRSILRQFTHLHAAAVRVRRRTVAIASPNRRRPQLPRRVGRENQRSAKQTDKQGSGSVTNAPPKPRLPRKSGHETSLPATSHKTDSAGGPNILLRGSWYQDTVRDPRAERSRHSRFSFEEFQIEIQGRIWGSKRRCTSSPSIC